jgi:hypothetical protein
MKKLTDAERLQSIERRRARHKKYYSTAYWLEWFKAYRRAYYKRPDVKAKKLAAYQLKKKLKWK